MDEIDNLIEGAHDDSIAKIATKSAQAIMAMGCDSVQIIVSRYIDNKSKLYHHGEGNWHSRYGAVREWIIIQDTEIKNFAREDRE